MLMLVLNFYKLTVSCWRESQVGEGAVTRSVNSRDFKIRDATAVRRDRK